MGNLAALECAQTFKAVRPEAELDQQPPLRGRLRVRIPYGQLLPPFATFYHLLPQAKVCYSAPRTDSGGTGMYRDIWEKWIQALRSGEYPQGVGELRKVDIFAAPGENKFDYCCLGVLCDLHSKETGIDWVNNDGAWEYQGNSGLLPTLVAEWAGVSKKFVLGNGGLNEFDILIGMETVSHLNDNLDLTFPQIADLIEAHIVPIEMVTTPDD